MKVFIQTCKKYMFSQISFDINIYLAHVIFILTYFRPKVKHSNSIFTLFEFDSLSDTSRSSLSREQCLKVLQLLEHFQKAVRKPVCNTIPLHRTV